MRLYGVQHLKLKEVVSNKMKQEGNYFQGWGRRGIFPRSSKGLGFQVNAHWPVGMFQDSFSNMSDPHGQKQGWRMFFWRETPTVGRLWTSKFAHFPCLSHWELRTFLYSQREKRAVCKHTLAGCDRFWMKVSESLSGCGWSPSLLA